MGLLNIFTGKAPEELEQTADAYMAAGEYGAAKVEFERALEKAGKKFPEKAALIRRLDEKVQNAKESLAGAHVQEAEELIRSGELAAAGDLLNLALELSGGDSQKAQIRKKIQALRQLRTKPAETPEKNQEKNPANNTDRPAAEPLNPEAGSRSEAVSSDEDAHFHILVSTLAEDQQEAYEGYGRSFRKGYIALNQGDFQTAVEKFREAIAENPSAGTWIPLELATAYINLLEPQKARETVEAYIRENPESLRAYQLLSDIYWEMGDYDAAVELLSSCPDALKQNLLIPVLLGETHYQAGRYKAARDVFEASRRQFGDEEIIRRALAKTYEAMGELDAARSLYAEMIKGCAGCGVRVDPFIKSRFAELSFQAGDSSTRILEMFLSLVQEDPDNRKAYYDRIGRIYEAGGNSAEARRYFEFSS